MLTIEVDEVANAKGHRNGLMEVNENGFMFKVGISIYFGNYDAANNILVYSYTANRQDFGNDVYLYEKNAVSIKGVVASHWLSGTVKLVEVQVTYENNVVETQNILITVDKVYGNVTLGSNVSIGDAYLEDEIKVYDSNNVLVFEFNK